MVRARPRALLFAAAAGCLSPLASAFLPPPTLRPPSTLPAVASPTASTATAAGTTESTSRPFETVTVDLEDRSYPIYIGAGLLQEPHFLLDHVLGKQALVVTNDVSVCLMPTVKESCWLRALPSSSPFWAGRG